MTFAIPEEKTANILKGLKSVSDSLDGLKKYSEQTDRDLDQKKTGVESAENNCKKFIRTELNSFLDSLVIEKAADLEDAKEQVS